MMDSTTVGSLPPATVSSRSFVPPPQLFVPQIVLYAQQEAPKIYGNPQAHHRPRRQIPVDVEVVTPAPGKIEQTNVLAQRSASACVAAGTRQGHLYVPPECPHRVHPAAGVEEMEPTTVHNLLVQKLCLLVDVRGEDRAAGLIDGAVHIPAFSSTGSFSSRIPELLQVWAGQSLVVFTCQYSAHRAPQCANEYRSRAQPAQRVAIMDGGFRKWEAVGLPVTALAVGEAAQSADKMALQIGTEFVKNIQFQPTQQVSQGNFQRTRPFTSAQFEGSHHYAKVGESYTAGPPKTVPPSVGHSHQSVQMPKPPRHQETVLLKPLKKYTKPYLPNTVATIKGVEHLEPSQVFALMKEEKCVLIDLRGDDRSAGTIAGAIHEPAIDATPFPIKVPGLVRQFSGTMLVAFTCQYSAHRAPQCANWYREKAPAHQRVAILSGGFRCWEGEGLPVVSAAHGAEAEAADKVAMRLGTQFVDGCITGVPGGGFCAPKKSIGQPPVSGVPGVVPQPQIVSGHTKPFVVALSDNVESLAPQTVYEMLKRRQCMLVDLRDEDQAAGLIEGAVHESAFKDEPFPAKVDRLAKAWADQNFVVFTCQYSAHRAPQCANWYREKSHPRQRVGVVAGGFRGWEAMGLPIIQRAVGDKAKDADQVALKLGAKFQAGCVIGVPGGGFCLPVK
eukprot:TRINITY_DN12840_c0_g1_i5.p1 TRINITY_DN12840_c0_g1~~TRINITY_DN12840_c0_g1_i5.p1  ORF type:complete len:719 (+),score=55.72 TRINITY_DN12840_c0_g1_i5:147-2159(+)